MSTIKMVLCLLTIAVAYGVVGTMDYEDAVLMENAHEHQALTDGRDSDCHPSARAIRNVQARDADVADEATGAAACVPNRHWGVRHVHRN
jgi:hypothetical protein